jgi:hypothetical protein
VKVILIEEDRFVDFTNKLKLDWLGDKENNNRPPYHLKDMDPEVWKAAREHAFRATHMTFCHWAQSHGASCVPKF